MDDEEFQEAILGRGSSMTLTQTLQQHHQQPRKKNKW